MWPLSISDSSKFRDIAHQGEVDLSSSDSCNPGASHAGMLNTLTTDLGHGWMSQAAEGQQLNADLLTIPLDNIPGMYGDPFMGAIADQTLIDQVLSERDESPAECMIVQRSELGGAKDDDLSDTIPFTGPNAGLQSSSIDSAHMYPESHKPGPSATVSTSKPFGGNGPSHGDKAYINTRENNQLRSYFAHDNSLDVLIDHDERDPGDERNTIQTILTEFSASTWSRTISSVLTTDQSREGLDSNESAEISSRDRLASQYSVEELLQEAPTSSFLPDFSNSCSLYRLDVYDLSFKIKELGHWSIRPLLCKDCLRYWNASFMRYFLFNNDVSWSDPYGNTALHIAAAGQTCLATLLNIIRLGVDVKRTNTAGQNFLHCYSEFMFQNEPEEDIDALARELIEGQFDFGQRDAEGETPQIPSRLQSSLWRAGANVIQEPSLPFMRKASLLEAGANCIHQDHNEKSCLTDAVRSLEKTDVIERLLSEGANINSRGALLETPLHISVKLGQIQTTRILIKYSPNIHARNCLREGVLAVGESALRQAKSDPSLYAKITACMTLAIDAGAIAKPTFEDEWRLPDYESYAKETWRLPARWE